MNNVRTYIAKKPKYKSKYYETGYPDDEYGVCTDVVANGLKDAGYDLKELVNEDIINNKEKYNVKGDGAFWHISLRRILKIKYKAGQNSTKIIWDIILKICFILFFCFTGRHFYA